VTLNNLHRERLSEKLGWLSESLAESGKVRYKGERLLYPPLNPLSSAKLRRTERYRPAPPEIAEPTNGAPHGRANYRSDREKGQRDLHADGFGETHETIFDAMPLKLRGMHKVEVT
jgi:hypothetical protein